MENNDLKNYDEVSDFNSHIPITQFEEPGEGDLAGLNEYEALKVTESSLILKKQAKNLITSLLDMYFEHEIMNENQYIKSVATVEAASLASLLNQTRYAEHAVQTLMRKIDAGLHTELGVFDMLINLQNNAVDIIMKVSQYTRSTAPYFRALKEEMTSGIGAIDVLATTDDQLMDDLGHTYKETEGKNYMGTKELNKELMEVAYDDEALIERGIDPEDLKVDDQFFGTEDETDMSQSIRSKEEIESDEEFDDPNDEYDN